MSTFDRAYGAQARQNRRDQLLGAHLPLVKHVVGRVAMELPDGVHLEPLEAGGLYGLLDAVAKCDPSRETDFPAEARSKIRLGIDDALRREWTPDEPALAGLRAVREAYRTLPPPADLAGLAVAAALPVEALVDSLISLRALERLRPPETGDGMPFDASDRAAADWANGRLDPSLLPIFTNLDTVSARLLTLYFREDLRLHEVSEILRLPQLETKRIYRRALWGIGESLRPPR